MILLAGGRILDGLGGPSFIADLLIQDGQVEAIGAITPNANVEVVDCRGFAIAPGFVDVHSHGDQEVLRHLPNKVLQGVTTEVVGNCGFSLFPSRPNPTGERLTGEIFDGEPREGLESAADYFQLVEQAGTLVNVAALAGHAALRIYAARMRRDLSELELGVIEHSLEGCLDGGALGFSTGLNCAPSSFGTFGSSCGSAESRRGAEGSIPPTYVITSLGCLKRSTRRSSSAGAPACQSRSRTCRSWVAKTGTSSTLC
jgi:N-acyl-D-aspartate/D-glutamate deacylase